MIKFIEKENLYHLNLNSFEGIEDSVRQEIQTHFNDLNSNTDIKKLVFARITPSSFFIKVIKNYDNIPGEKFVCYHYFSFYKSSLFLSEVDGNVFEILTSAIDGGGFN
ncbi:hypothetical protein [Bacillus sp. 2205SS5-2]|uniref:hypothetical protein n=1 Tax=Bacillus sp. 2205SS5-2 TaxID=3109031 RepID=UPI003007A569